jgi:hypothetical protein
MALIDDEEARGCGERRRTRSTTFSQRRVLELGAAPRDRRAPPLLQLITRDLRA